MRRAALRVLAATALGMMAAAPLAAQQVAPGQLVEQARAQLDELRPDSAVSLLRYALDPRTGAGVRERLRGWTLLGIAELVAGRRTEARQAFREALALAPDLRVDSLEFLHSDLRATFEAERSSLARASRVTLVVEVPADTSVLLQGGGYRVTALPTRAATVMLFVTRESGEEIHSDSQVTDGVTAFDWNLRTYSDSVVSVGRYVLRLQARDAAGQTAIVERMLTIEAEPLDTLPLPAPPSVTELDPESTQVRERQTGPLLRGVLYGSAAAMLAYLGPGPGGSRDSRAVAVGGTIALGGLAGFLSGQPAWRPNPAAAERNSGIRDRYAAQRTAIEQANARAHERARIRIRAGGR
jgi:hypothetical protein